MSEKKNLIQLWFNETKRRAFLAAYKEWDLLAETPEMDLTYYRYLLPDEIAIIAEEHRQKSYIGYNKGYEWETGVSYICAQKGRTVLSRREEQHIRGR